MDILGILKSKILLTLTIIVVLFTALIMGCGVSKEEYDRVNAQLSASEARVAGLQNEVKVLEEQYEIAEAELKASEAKVVELQGETRELRIQYEVVDAQLRASETKIAELLNEITGLGEQYEIVGDTPSETAGNIVRYYYETHIYSKYDFFVCSDMALDVWNMLKAQGINALIQIGNVETGAGDIAEADHAWVLAEISSGQYLALETTGGYVVRDNPLYYRGWSFDNPREYKRFVELMKEYNVRVRIIKQLEEAFEASKSAGMEVKTELDILTEEVSEMSVLNPQLCSKIAKLIEKAEEYGEYVGRCDQLNELTTQQGQELENIVSEMQGLTD